MRRNSGQGTTCEFSMGYDENLPKKMEILAEFNEKLNGGLWVVFHCSTCVKHSEGEKPLHAMIFKNT